MLVSATTAVAQPSGPPPTIIALFRPPEVGDLLVDQSGRWNGAPVTVTIQWLDCHGTSCSPVAANGNSLAYTVATSDIGSTIEVQETATDGSGNTASLDSAPTLAVLGPPANVNPPTITPTGPVALGDVLTAHTSPADWMNNPASFAYQWLDCNASGGSCSDVAGTGTNRTYTVTAGDAGSRIAVQVTASNRSGMSAPAQSLATSTVPGAGPSNLTPPTISGTPAQGQQLTVTSGTWTDSPTIADQWMRCDAAGDNCAAIVGSVGATYTLGSADVGNTIEVQETATKNSASGGPVFSAHTAVITALSPFTPPTSATATTTSLVTVPTNPITDQSVTLVATVTSGVSGPDVSGSVSFQASGTPISGCAAVAVSSAVATAIVTCEATFSATASPDALTAAFTPAAGASLAGSASGAISLTIGSAPTSITLRAPGRTALTGANVTYTATVNPILTGPFQPTGSVSFFDHGRAIPSCQSVPLTVSGGIASARCAIRYAKAASPTITASYGGDGGFGGSTSHPASVTVRPRGPTVLGTITAKTRWTYFFTVTYTKFTSMKIHSLASGSRILLFCHSGGCPFARRSLIVQTKSCGKRPACIAEKDQVVDLSRLLRGRRLAVGAVLTVELTRPQWVGKAYVITIRSGSDPSDRIECLKPGSTRPGVGC
jgi:hypothetical protein